MEQSPKTPPMNTSPTHSPAGNNKMKKSSSSKEVKQRQEIDLLISNRSHANSPSSKSSGSSQSSENISGQSQQELPQIRNISSLTPYLIGRNFESFSGVCTKEKKLKESLPLVDSEDKEMV
jgi:hypothetical protein